MQRAEIMELSGILLRVSCFKRRAFFRIWNQLREDNLIWTQRLKVTLLNLLEREEIPLAPELPPHLRFISMIDGDYPTDLLELPQPPVGLFVQGTLAMGKRAAVIGSRKPTPYARRVTREITRKWVQKGWIIISGGAVGIDGDAHHACIEAEGLSWVVMGSGHFRLYPSHHEKLFHDILKMGGALISEYPPFAEARPYTFPERNRIIAALGQTLFLAQAHAKSGSLSTARAALDLGREIYVLRPIPGDENFAGSQTLIEAGAHVLVDAREILEGHSNVQV